MPEDDSPTMSGVPDERLARHVGTQELPDSDNTAAQSEPPAHRQSIPGQGSIAPPDESNEPHGADEEDRTVQQAPQGALERVCKEIF